MRSGFFKQVRVTTKVTSRVKGRVSLILLNKFRLLERLLLSYLTLTLTTTQTLTLTLTLTPNLTLTLTPVTTVVTGSYSSIVIINGALASNIYWAVGSSATIGQSD
jgi:hypothetical protein